MIRMTIATACATALTLTLAACSVASVPDARPGHEQDAVIDLAATYTDSGGSGGHESTGETGEAIIGPGPCDGGQSVCWQYHGQDIIYGTCSLGACCFGCVDARGACQAGNETGVCGLGGAACANCNDGLECTNDACNPSGGVCYHVNKTNDTTCGRGGHCDPDDGTCCAGAFVINPITLAYACAPACPSCTCKDPASGVCLPSSNVPVVCGCP
jgi:hypothetical protein